jgi:mono/diheme cytochrome c family protein
MRKVARGLLLSGVMSIAFAASNLSALPFNDDMVHDQFKTNEVMRPLPEGSVSLSAPDKEIKNLQEAKELRNPIQDDPISTFNGERLWRVNCSPCHGVYEKGKYNPGVVGSKLPIPGPDLSQEAYLDRTDGHIWGIIHFGSAIMPRLGWKLTDREHWDLVNYVRLVQKKNKSLKK